MIFAAGLLLDAVENLQRLGWLPFGRQVLWNSSHVVAEGSSFGDVLHSLLGYADHPTLLQALSWFVYVTVATTAFVRSGRRRHRLGHRAPPEDASRAVDSAPSPENN
jgi:high-affinity iron transporter